MTTPLIACSRMYNVSPEVTAAWDALFAYVSTQADVPFKMMYHAFPDPIEDLWVRPDMGCVLMCGYPYARANPRPTLLATPVPAFPQYEHKAVYFTHLLVAEDSPFQTIEDTFGHRISWTIENSQSGFNALRTFLLSYRTPDRPNLYRASIGPIGTFTVGVEGIHNDEIDVVPIDSFSYDLMQLYTPEKLAGTRVIATTGAAPFPPLVAKHSLEDVVADRLRDVLLHAHTASSLQPHFETMKLERFTTVTTETYETTLAQARIADEADYPFPA
ncbi:MAG: PhnD/SsuA/transferrin family substrate-binding protein [Chloroflexota bacterium]